MSLENKETSSSWQTRRIQNSTIDKLALFVATGIGLSLITLPVDATTPELTKTTSEHILSTNQYTDLLNQLGMYAPDTSSAYVADYEQVVTPADTTIEESIGFIEDTYGIEVIIPTEEFSIYRNTPNERVIKPIKALDDDARLTDLQAVENALSFFSAPVINNAHTDKLYLVGSIWNGDNPWASYGGFYVQRSTNSATYISTSGDAENIELATWHEFEHDLSESADVDSAISDLNSIPYGLYSSDEISSLIEPGHLQEFVDSYAATNVNEDRSVTFSNMIANGLILPGDSAWGSPLQLKQAELVRRQESMTPGFAQALLERTCTLRSINLQIRSFPRS